MAKRGTTLGKNKAKASPGGRTKKTNRGKSSGSKTTKREGETVARSRKKE